MAEPREPSSGLLRRFLGARRQRETGGYVPAAPAPPAPEPPAPRSPWLPEDLGAALEPDRGEWRFGAQKTTAPAALAEPPSATAEASDAPSLAAPDTAVDPVAAKRWLPDEEEPAPIASRSRWVADDANGGSTETQTRLPPAAERPRVDHDRHERAVRSYCEELCEPALVAAAVAETMKTFDATPGAGEDQLLAITRTVATKHATASTPRTGWRAALTAEHDDECARTQVLLAARANGELDANGGAELDRHLAACPRCQAAELRAARAERAFVATIGGGAAAGASPASEWLVPGATVTSSPTTDWSVPEAAPTVSSASAWLVPDVAAAGVVEDRETPATREAPAAPVAAAIPEAPASDDDEASRGGERWVAPSLAAAAVGSAAFAERASASSSAAAAPPPPVVPPTQPGHLGSSGTDAAPRRRTIEMAAAAVALGIAAVLAVILVTSGSGGSSTPIRAATPPTPTVPAVTTPPAAPVVKHHANKPHKPARKPAKPAKPAKRTTATAPAASPATTSPSTIIASRPPSTPSSSSPPSPAPTPPPAPAPSPTLTQQGGGLPPTSAPTQPIGGGKR